MSGSNPSEERSSAARSDAAFDYNRPRRKSRSMHHRMQRRSLKRRLAKVAFLAVVVVASLLAAYLVAG